VGSERVSASGCPGTIAVLDVRPLHFDREQPPIGIGQDVALARFVFLARIIAPRSPF